eukprot:gnl/MRDRNA2_/MRDRNA2_40617_c0_seq1.p1 gnl/MRDRNA2_/MRDRNA2_40617_c0~~gnl/MRDRNA2_/MRDRNA2_40617_c0_seq1.p1  ORF type:complete len:217 (-),score=49.53 gnl/MRDRNA2_/MRDRNA2_40617_c0_seq1:77-727(-)
MGEVLEETTKSLGAPDGDEIPAGLQEPPLVLRCKIVLLGDSTVGKTSIASVFHGGVQNFPKNYNMTVGIDFNVKRVQIPDTNVTVEMYIVDCGGFSICQDLLKPHWENANAIMLVYDVSSPDSFKNLASWYEKIQQSRMESAITGVVIANKTDLMDRPGSVPPEMGQEFSKGHGLEFFEACATKGVVDAPFHFLAEVFYQKYDDRCKELAELSGLH